MAVHHRIPRALSGLLLAVAIIVDGIQFLLVFLWFTVVLGILSYVVSLLLTLLIMTVYSMIFMGVGVNPIGGKGVIKKITAFCLTSLSEVIPILGEFTPSLTIWTWMVIHQSRVEDRETAKQNAILEKQQQEEMLRIQKKRRERREQWVANDNFPVAANDDHRVANNSGYRERKRAA